MLVFESVDKRLIRDRREAEKAVGGKLREFFGDKGHKQMRTLSAITQLSLCTLSITLSHFVIPSSSDDVYGQRLEALKTLRNAVYALTPRDACLQRLLPTEMSW